MPKLTEPLSLRISDKSDPRRGTRFAEVLDKRGASAPDVLKKLIDAYIASDGGTPFPVRLEQIVKPKRT